MSPILQLSPAPLTESNDTLDGGRPFKSDASNRRRVVALEIESSRRRAALDTLQVAFAVSGPDGRFPSDDLVGAGPCPPADDDVARIVARPHAVALDLKRDCVRSNRKRHLDFVKSLGGNLFEFGLNRRARANAPNDPNSVAGGWISYAFEQPRRRCLQNGSERHQRLGSDAAPVAVSDGALEVADGVWPFCGKRRGVRRQTQGSQPTFDAGQNVH